MKRNFCTHISFASFGSFLGCQNTSGTQIIQTLSKPLHIWWLIKPKEIQIHGENIIVKNKFHIYQLFVYENPVIHGKSMIACNILSVPWDIPSELKRIACLKIVKVAESSIKSYKAGMKLEWSPTLMGFKNLRKPVVWWPMCNGKLNAVHMPPSAGCGFIQRAWPLGLQL